jgi:DMSO/TMAO reductase YedYZ molybdopterin-dependent catalytic subunit
VSEAKERTGPWAALSGVVSVVVGLAGGELLASGVSPAVSPVTAVGGVVIDVLPPWVKEQAIALFGTADKAVFVLSMGVVIAVLAALLGMLSLRHKWWGLAGIAAFGVAGALAVLSRAQSTTTALLPPLAAAGLAILLLSAFRVRLLRWLPVTASGTHATTPDPVPGARAGRRGTATATATGPAGAGTDTSTLIEARDSNTIRTPAGTDATSAPERRQFLRAIGVGAVVAAVSATVAGVVRTGVSAVAQAREKLKLPVAASVASVIPAGADLRTPEVAPLVTPNADFYRIDTALVVPSVDPGSWKLTITGMVEREVQIDLPTLLALPLIERHITIACVSNEVGGNLVGNAKWLGYPVRDLLARAGVKPGADMVLSRSTDGFTAGTPLEVLTDDRDAMVAVGMNGSVLPLEHGFPARLIVPGLYGFVSATKWVSTLKVTRFADDVAYWSSRGWSDHGPIKTSSRIDTPRANRTVPAGHVAVGGVAWAPHAGISRVQLRVDDGPWQDAQLAPGISADTWYQWVAHPELGRGQHRLQVRAFDGGGTPQTAQQAPVAPDGASGYHTISITVG